ncbi:MAG: hypothetical protein Q7K35_03545 [bacterium]|nr:hypothetical protein [bacterium]
MEKKSGFFKKTAGLMAFLFILAFAMPVQAFYVEMPKSFAQNWQSLIADKVKSIQKVLGVKVLGEEEVNSLAPAPLENQINFIPPQGTNNQLPQNQPFADMCPGDSGDPINTDMWCFKSTGERGSAPKLVSGAPTCPAGFTAKCGPRMNQQPGNNQQNNNQQGPNGQGNQNQGGQNQGDQNQQKNQKRMMQDVKRNIKQMESGLKRLESAFKSAGSKGTAIPAEVSDKLKEARNMMEIMKAAGTPEAMQEIDLGGLNETMQSLEQSRQDIVEGAQRMDNIKRGVKSMESGLKMFESQITKLIKQKVAMPAEVTENLNKVKAIIAAVKNAKTMDEMTAAGAEDLQEAMQNLDESRGQLEMLARWPQTLKQMNSELTRLTAELKKAKTIVERLKKQEIDLSDTYVQFEAAAAKMKTVKEEAEKNVKAGGSSEVFDTIQADFFGQMEDTMQYQRVIMTMSNLGGFTANFKKIITQAQSQIRKLKAKKLEAGSAEVILNDLNNKGKEISAMLKAKPINEDDIILALEDMDALNQNFNDEISALTGVQEIMPWEQGPKQFSQTQMPSNWQQLMPQQDQNQNQTCPPCNCQQNNQGQSFPFGQ